MSNCRPSQRFLLLIQLSNDVISHLLQGDQLNMAIFFWYHVYKVTSPMNAFPAAYTRQVTFYKVPVLHGHVYLVGLYLGWHHVDQTGWSSVQYLGTHQQLQPFSQGHVNKSSPKLKLKIRGIFCKSQMPILFSPSSYGINTRNCNKIE